MEWIFIYFLLIMPFTDEAVVLSQVAGFAEEAPCRQLEKHYKYQITAKIQAQHTLSLGVCLKHDLKHPLEVR